MYAEHRGLILQVIVRQDYQEMLLKALEMIQDEIQRKPDRLIRFRQGYACGSNSGLCAEGESRGDRYQTSEVCVPG